MDAPMINGVAKVGGREVAALLSPVRTEALIKQVAANSSLGDVVEISQRGLALSQIDIRSPLDVAQIREIRAEIKAGVFVTPERIEGLVDRLLDILG